jgi:hypothetical protein
MALKHDIYLHIDTNHINNINIVLYIFKYGIIIMLLYIDTNTLLFIA